MSADWVELELSVPEDVTVEADPSRLMTVFENLLANACQHNEPPLSIRVGTLDPVEQESPREIRGFFVEDDGVSLPLSEEIFEYGYTDSTDGTGLGLAIVQEIVEAHGWSISLVDVPDGGARFEILLDEPGSVS